MRKSRRDQVDFEIGEEKGVLSSGEERDRSGDVIPNVNVVCHGDFPGNSIGDNLIVEPICVTANNFTGLRIQNTVDDGDSLQPSDEVGACANDEVWSWSRAKEPDHSDERFHWRFHDPFYQSDFLQRNTFS